MYKGASQNAQYAREIGPLREAAAAATPEVLDQKQQREALKSAFWAVEAELERVGKQGAERPSLIARKRDIEAQLAALPRCFGQHTPSDFFRWAAREVLPTPTYEMILARAATIKRQQDDAIPTLQSGAGE